MKSNLVKKTAIIAVVLLIAIIPSFARSHGRDYGHNRGGSGYNRSSYSNRNSNSYGHNNGGCRGYDNNQYGHNRGGCGGYANNSYGCNEYVHGYGCSEYGYNSGYQLVGTIQFMDTDANTISVVNADGSVIIVRINPTTRIINMTDFPAIRNYNQDIDTSGMTDSEIQSEFYTARVAAEEEWATEMESRILDFDNLKTGDWVEVSTLATETVTKDANYISVYR